MATLITLIKTSSGVIGLSQTLEGFKGSIQKAGGTCEWYLCLGSYDAVVITKGVKRGDLVRAGAANLSGVDANTMSGYDLSEVQMQIAAAD